MVKSKIEWTDYTLNPIKGMCPVACKNNQGKNYCYARQMYQRFKWNPKIRFDWSVANNLSRIKKPSRIFWGSTMELFGDWVDPEWMRLILESTKRHPEHTNIFLTKQPQNLTKWSPFPDNCWVGVSATNREKFVSACTYLEHIKSKVKFVSIEPLLDWHDGHGVDIKGYLQSAEVNWLIVGQCTPISAKTQPKIEWIQEIIEAADRVGVLVFLKNNLRDFIYGEYGGKYKQIFKYTQDGRELRQEYPK